MAEPAVSVPFVSARPHKNDLGSRDVDRNRSVCTLLPRCAAGSHATISTPRAPRLAEGQLAPVLAQPFSVPVVHSGRSPTPELRGRRRQRNGVSSINSGTRAYCTAVRLSCPFLVVPTGTR